MPKTNKNKLFQCGKDNCDCQGTVTHKRSDLWNKSKKVLMYGCTKADCKC